MSEAHVSLSSRSFSRLTTALQFSSSVARDFARDRRPPEGFDRSTSSSTAFMISFRTDMRLAKRSLLPPLPPPFSLSAWTPVGGTDAWNVSSKEDL